MVHKITFFVTILNSSFGFAASFFYFLVFQKNYRQLQLINERPHNLSSRVFFGNCTLLTTVIS